MNCVVSYNLIIILMMLSNNIYYNGNSEIDKDNAVKAYIEIISSSYLFDTCRKIKNCCGIDILNELENIILEKDKFEDNSSIIANISKSLYGKPPFEIISLILNNIIKDKSYDEEYNKYSNKNNLWYLLCTPSSVENLLFTLGYDYVYSKVKIFNELPKKLKDSLLEKIDWYFIIYTDMKNILDEEALYYYYELRREVDYETKKDIFISLVKYYDGFCLPYVIDFIDFGLSVDIINKILNNTNDIEKIVYALSDTNPLNINDYANRPSSYKYKSIYDGNKITIVKR